MFTTTQDVSRDRGTRPKRQPFDHDIAQDRQAIAPMIEIGTVSVDLDLPIGKLFVRVLQEVMPWISSLGRGQDVETTTLDPSPLEATIKLVNISVCEEVPELSHDQGVFDPLEVLACDEEKLLLQASLSDINFSISSDGISTLQRLAVGNVSVNHKNKSVMSFADAWSGRSSVSASTLPLSDDFVVTTHIKKSSKHTDIQMKSLRLKLDLLQIDDVLSRSGGLSSLLDLGNSIVSTSTIRGGSPKVKAPESRQRSVRFVPPRSFPQDEDSVDGAGAGKVNIRIAGISLELIGSVSAMRVRSSPIKVAYRKELIGLQIDWTEVEGPLLKGQTKGDIRLRMNNTRLEYSNSPEEADLERLISILMPSSDKQDAEKDDDIMVDTLLRQRRKGGVLRFTLASTEANIRGLQWQKHVTKLGDELSRLSSVSKYLPEDDRPGMLTLALLKKVDINLILDPVIGTFWLKADLTEAAHVNVPSLMAAHLTTLQVSRDKDCILGDVISSADPRLAMGPPMFMVRYIADGMEPTVRLKVFNLMLEYKVSTVAAFIELGNALQSAAEESRPLSPTSSISSSSNAAMTRSRNTTRISLAVRDSALGLNPLKSTAKVIVLLTDATLMYTAGKSGGARR